MITINWNQVVCEVYNKTPDEVMLENELYNGMWHFQNLLSSNLPMNELTKMKEAVDRQTLSQI